LPRTTRSSLACVHDQLVIEPTFS